MKKILRLMILIITLFTLCLLGGATVFDATTDSNIKFIVTTPGEDPSTQMTINYHCFVRGSYIEYTLASDYKFENATRVTPNETWWSLNGVDKATTTDSFYTKGRYSCNYTLTGLSPRTKYIYRVVCGDEISSTFRFTTAGLTNNWSFVAMADYQNWNNSISHPFITMLRSLAGNSPLVIDSGDLMDISGHEEEWDWLLGSTVWQDFTFAAAPGDHEYWADYQGSSICYAQPYAYNAILCNPKNGASSSLNSNYYFIYNNVLFVALDLLDSDTVKGSRMTAQVQWFKETISSLEGQYQYLVVYGHKSMYGSKVHDSRVSTDIRGQWEQVFYDYNVDLVISGHDHTYHRTNKLLNGEVIEDSVSNRRKGLYFLDIGTSGNKRYDLDKGQENDPIFAKTMDFLATGHSGGAVIEVTDSQMNVNVYLENGTLIDSFICYAKRAPLEVSTEGFNQDEFIESCSLELTNVETKKGNIKFADGEMLKYVNSVKVLDGEDVLDTVKINYNINNYTYEISNVEKTEYDLEFELNDGSTFRAHKGFSYWDKANIEFDEDEPLTIVWDKKVADIKGYEWFISVDGTILERLTNQDLKTGSFRIPNKYVIEDHEVKVGLVVENDVISEFELSFDGAGDLVLSSDEVSVGVNQSINIGYDFPYEELLEISVANESIAVFENGVLTGISEGTTKVTFKIANTNIKYNFTVTVTAAAKSKGCGGKAATEVISLLTLLSIAYVITKKRIK